MPRGADRARVAGATVFEALELAVAAGGLLVAVAAFRARSPLVLPLAVVLAIASLEAALVVAGRQGLFLGVPGPSLDLALVGALALACARLAGLAVGRSRAFAWSVAAVVVAGAAAHLALSPAPVAGIAYFVAHQALLVGAAALLAFPTSEARAHAPRAWLVAGVVAGIAFTATKGTLELATAAAGGAGFGWARAIDVGSMPALLFFSAVAAARWSARARVPALAAIAACVAGTLVSLLPRSSLMPPLGELVIHSFRPALVAWGIATAWPGAGGARAVRATAVLLAGIGVGAVALAALTWTDLLAADVPAVAVLGALLVVLAPIAWILGRRRDAATASARGRAGALAPGAVIAGRFEVRAALGAGGQGRAFEARDLLEGTSVVLKEALGGDGASLAREARAAASVRSPFVARVHGLVSDESGSFLVRELVPGRVLHEVVPQDRGLAPLEAARVMRDVLAGLSALHEAGVAHGDLKPANVIVRDDGRAVLIDLGIARRVPTEDATRTATDVGVGAAGSLGWTAPEVLLGAPAGPPADVYGAGLLARFLLTGRAPFPTQGRSAFEVAEAVTRGPPLPAIGGALDAAVSRATARDVASRTRSAAAFSADIARAVEEQRAPHADEIARG